MNISSTPEHLATVAAGNTSCSPSCGAAGEFCACVSCQRRCAGEALLTASRQGPQSDREIPATSTSARSAKRGWGGGAPRRVSGPECGRDGGAFRQGRSRRRRHPCAQISRKR